MRSATRLDVSTRADAKLEWESDITFAAVGAEDARGLSLATLSPDQLEEAERLFGILVAPFRAEDRDAVQAALAVQGGLGACRLSFFEPWYRRGGRAL